MAKIFTEIELDRPRKMRFGFKIIREMDQAKDEMSKLGELDIIVRMVQYSLKEDDATVSFDQVIDLIDEYGLEYISKKLEETIQRDMPGLMQQLPKLQAGTIDPNA